MAKYTEKNDADLAWNRIRREVQYKANLAAAHWKEVQLNKILPKLQAEFEEALSSGQLLELEASDSWVSDFLDAAKDA